MDTPIDSLSRDPALHHGSARYGHSRIKSIEVRQCSPTKRSGLSGASPHQFEDEDENDPGSPTPLPRQRIL